MSSSQLEGLVGAYSCVSLGEVQRRASQDCLPKRWCAIGCVGEISGIKHTVKGDPYNMWKVTDLKETVITLMVFGDAYHHWKDGVRPGSLITLVSPRTSKSSEAFCLSISSGEQVRVLGKSPEFGYCRAKRKVCCDC